MLRITAHNKLNAVTFQLEGRLAGPWVGVLEECWRSAQARPDRPTVCLDLTGITSIDSAGRACLAVLHQQGAELVAADGLTKEVMAEITHTRATEQRFATFLGACHGVGTDLGSSLFLE